MGSLVKKSFFDEENDTEDLSVVSHETVRSKVRKPAWNDEEEDAVKMNIANVNRLRKLRKVEKESVISGSDYISRLRAQHVKIYGSAQWADLDNEESNEGANVFLFPMAFSLIEFCNSFGLSYPFIHCSDFLSVNCC